MEQNKRKQCKSLSITKKVKIINKLEPGTPVKELVAKYGITAYTIYKFTKKKTLIKTKNKSVILSGKKTLHKPKEEALDKRLYAWFLKKRSNNMPILGPILIPPFFTVSKNFNVKVVENWSRWPSHLFYNARKETCPSFMA